MSTFKQEIEKLILKQHAIVQRLKEEDEVDSHRFTSLRWAQGRLAGLRSAAGAMQQAGNPVSETPSGVAFDEVEAVKRGGALDVNCTHCGCLQSSIEVDCTICGTALPRV